MLKKNRVIFCWNNCKKSESYIFASQQNHRCRIYRFSVL
jgi:hypothetical protein